MASHSFAVGICSPAILFRARSSGRKATTWSRGRLPPKRRESFANARDQNREVAPAKDRPLRSWRGEAPMTAAPGDSSPPILNIPNSLSLSRLVLAAVSLILIDFDKYSAALVVFVLAAVSDGL